MIPARTSVQISTGLVLGLLMLAGAAAADAQSMDDYVEFDIPAQPLGSALLAYSDQANVQIVASTLAISGFTSQSVSGLLSKREALRRLLAGTGLAYRTAGLLTVTISSGAGPDAMDQEPGTTGNAASPGSAGPDFGRATAAAERDSDGDQSLSSRAAQLEEVVVTARKREEDLQDVPAAIVALRGADLNKFGIEKVRDLEFVLPNFAAPGGDLDSFVNFAIRGVQTRPRNIGSESGLGFFVDGFYLGRQATFNRDLVDVQRVEVLYGPQGTLFGKNTSLGAINIVTRKPDSGTGGSATFELGNYNLVRTTATAGGSLIDRRLYARASISKVLRDGYVTNINDGADASTLDRLSGRLDLRYERPDLTADLSMDTSHSDSDIAFTTLVDGPLATRPHEIDYDLSSWEKTNSSGTSVTLDWTLPNDDTLTSMTSYRDQGYKFVFDSDETPMVIFHLNPWTANESLFTQEIRLVPPPHEALSYVLGIYYLRQSLTSFRDFTLGDPLGGGRGFDDSTVNVDSLAVFGNLQFRLLDILTANVGVRFTKESKQVRYTQNGAGSYGDFPLFEDERSDSGISPTAALQMDVSDHLMLYYRAAKSRKSGGFNVDIVTSLERLEFGDESATTQEVGIKADLFDKTLRFNTAAFYSKFDDLQVVQFVGGIGSIISNAARATSKGFETSMTWVAGRALVLSGNVGYADATFDRYPDATPLGEDFSGHTLSGPRWTGSAVAEYTILLPGSGSLRIRGEYTYRDEIYHSPENRFENHTDAFSLVNGRVEYTTGNEAWKLALWSKNLLDSTYTTIAFPALGPAEYGTKLEHYGPPRMYGLEATYRF